MDALLGIIHPGPEQFRIPVPPSQLKVGHKYLHLDIRGLRQMEILRAQKMVAPIPMPELETVTIKSINTQVLFNTYKILIVGYQIDGQDGNNYVMIPFQSEEELNKYNHQSMHMFFRIDPTNRRAPLLHYAVTEAQRNVLKQLGNSGTLPTSITKNVLPKYLGLGGTRRRGRRKSTRRK